MKESQIIIKLPSPKYNSDTSLEAALKQRRSIREYSNKPLSLKDISQILWSAQGITGAGGLRTAPSAGALYPLEIYLIVGQVENLPNGVYKYHPEKHELTMEIESDLRANLCKAALDQKFILESVVSIVITAIYERVTIKYGKRGIMYVHMEAGHAAQNIHLQAEALNLGTVAVGAFYDERVKNVLRLPNDEQPLYILPIGRKLT